MRTLKLAQRRTTDLFPAKFGVPARFGRPARSPRTSSMAMPLVLGLIASMSWLVLRRFGRRSGRTVKDVMIGNVISVDSSATLAEAAQLMRDGNVGVLPVVEAGRLRGLLTDRDIVVRAVARGLDARSTRVAECATPDIVSAKPEWSADEAGRAMARHQIGRLPVVDEDGHLVGIVTLSSLALRSHDAERALHAAEQVSRRSARHA
jgi:CBS domain-containing protein